MFAEVKGRDVCEKERKERNSDLGIYYIEVGQGMTNHSRIKTTMPILAILIVRTMEPHPIRGPVSRTC